MPDEAPTETPEPERFQTGERVLVQCNGYRSESVFEKYDETSELACYVRGHGRILLSRVSRARRG